MSQFVRTLAALVGPAYFGLVLILGGWLFQSPSREVFVDSVLSLRIPEPPQLGDCCLQLFGTILSLWGLSLVLTGICDATQVWRREQES